MSDKIVYLMRGLPSCGKSTTAKKLAGDTGLICETDEYFYTQVGDDPTRFDYRKELMEDARRWNFERFKKAIDDGITPVVVDRGNSRSLESQQYVFYAMERGYTVELREPESEWWQEIRVLLKYKRLTRPALYEWADRLAEMSKSTHRVPASTIRRWMDKWKWDLTIEDIVDYDPEPQQTADAAEDAATADTSFTVETSATANDRANPPTDAEQTDTEPPPTAEADEPPQYLLPTEKEIFLADSPLKPGERSPFL